MITVTVEKINGVALAAGANTKYKIDRQMFARPPQPLTADTVSSKCRLWIKTDVGGPTVEEWLVTETFAAVTDAITTDEAESGSEVLTNKATDFSTLNDTLYPTTEGVSEVFQPIWYAASTGTNTYAITLTGVVPTAYYAGMRIRTIFPNANTTAATINVNALGAKAITKHVSTALIAGDIVVNKVYDLVYDGTRFQIASPTGTGALYAVTTGIADVSVAVINFPEAAYTTGLPFQVKFNITNATTTPTLNVNGLGAKTIVKGVDGATALSAADLVITKIYTLIYDGTNLQINL